LKLVRPLLRSDLDQVAALYELVARSGRRDPPPGLRGYFERTMLDHPWVDEEIPSLVHLDRAGAIVGFQGSHVRRVKFDGRSARVACAGQLITHPDARSGAVGALLLRAYLGGPQDLTITDGATEPMRQIWTLLGGRMAHLACVSWLRVLRPLSWTLDRFIYQPRRRPHLAQPRHRGRTAVGWLDAAAGRTALPRPEPIPSVTAEPLTATSLVEQVSELGTGLRLYPAYDTPYVEWLFRELSAVHVRGTPVAHLIRERRSGRLCGWYVYYLLTGGVCQVLQVAAPDRDVSVVLDHLLHHAWSNGAAAVGGRIEPRLLEPLARRRCLMKFTGEALLHSLDGEILGAVATGNALLTRLDGEWWMGHHMLEFGTAR
jgi:hypothetical protein